MARIKLNPAIDMISGRIDQFVYREMPDGSLRVVKISLPKPDYQPSPAQLAQRERFRDAMALYKLLVQDPATRASYREILAGRSPLLHLDALVAADVLHPPQITRIDLSTFHGLAGGLIRIYAEDTVAVARLTLSIHDLLTGTLLETAEMRPDNHPLPRAVVWTYHTTSDLPAAHPAELRLAAYDLAHNCSEQTTSLPPR